MSGHNKWSTIKRKKGALDAKRSKIFSRIVKEIQIAVKEGGPDENYNPRLRLAIQNGKGANMSKDTISKAISKADKEGSNLQEVTFEGYAPGGVAVFIECLTDNNNRSVSNIRSVFNKKGGTLGTNGSLSFLFERKGVITLKKEGLNPDDFELEIIDAGAEDIQDEGDVYTIYTSLESFSKVRKKLEEMKLEPENASLQRIPNDLKKLPREEAMKVIRMVEDFEDDDDVQNVYHNLELTDEIIAAMEQ
ncbi:MAG: YebC/PmpR family DNA-binding transcriptional regulator [Bacteroidales bacterium]